MRSPDLPVYFRRTLNLFLVLLNYPPTNRCFLLVAPPAKTILVPGSVIRVDPILNIHTAFLSPWASRVKIPFGPVPEIPLVDAFT